MKLINKNVLATVVLSGFLSGCATSVTKTDQQNSMDKNALTAIGAIGGLILANQFTDNNFAKLGIAALAGYTSRQMYQELTEGLRNNPNATIKVLQSDANYDYVQVTFVNASFESGKYTMHPNEVRQYQPVVDEMLNHEEIDVVITGYTDSDGSQSYNQKLSERRALWVGRQFIGAGIAAHRISTQGHGENNPIASNKTSYGKSQNRRIEFILRTPKIEQ